MVELATRDHEALRVAVLGPLSLTVDGRDVAVPGSKRRAVLALLAMAAPEVASADRLVDGVWPDEPPASGRAALQSHVSRLRRHLGPHASRLTRTDAGYRLALAAGELDAARFAALVDDARGLAAGDPGAASALLVEARRLWRGAPLEELRDVTPVAAWARALTEAWLGACDLLAECLLRQGDPGGAAAATADALAAEPHREASARLLLRALAAGGRSAEALRAGHEFRRRLVEDTGLDASPLLAEVERQIAGGTVTVRPPHPPRPAPADPFLGREAEVSGLRRLLVAERLVTIVGPGGVGKTRLAIEVARRAPPATTVTFVDLSPLTDPASAPDVLARALGLESSKGDPLDRSVAYLAHGEHLVVVDNCEHVLDAARNLVARLLAGCAGLTVLATSRERLGLAGEQTSRLAPLPMPSVGDQDVADVASVALFLDRARRARPEFAPDAAQLAAICRVVRALDGLPLAVELAAGRLSSLALDDLEARLDRALDVLTDRQRALRATIEWSYDLLGPDERQLFLALSAFPGGFDLATAEAVGDELGLSVDPATALARLVDSSMVVAELDGRPRYRMLDTLRHFGLERLRAEGELSEAERRLVRWAVRFVGEVDDAYETERDQDADRRLRDELANLRAAWRTARDHGDLDAAAAMAVGLYAYASWRDLTELFRWMLELAADPSLVGSPHEATVLGVASEAAWFSRGDLDSAEQLARRAAAAVRAGDALGAAAAAWALGDVFVFRGRYREASELSLAGRRDTRWPGEGPAQAALALTYAGDVEAAHRHLAEAERLVRGQTLRAYTRYVAGELANATGHRAQARAAYEDAIELAGAVGATFIEGIASVGLVTAHTAEGDLSAALAGYDSLIDRWERTGAWTQQWTTLRNLADLLDRFDDSSTATALRAAAANAPEAAAAPDQTEPSSNLTRDEALAVARTAIARHLRSLR